MAGRKTRSDCPINLSLEAWGDKWSLLIIRDLMFEGKRTYGDFLTSHEKISTNILAARLRSLQDHGIVRAIPPQGGGTAKGYALTQKGIDMLPLMLEVYLWADKYYPIPDHVAAILETVKSDKSRFAARAMQTLREAGRPAD